MSDCSFKPGETYRTRDGREARIYATDGPPDLPVHGAVKQEYGWAVREWTANGRHQTSDGCDLTPPKKKIWVAVCRHGFSEEPQAYVASSEAAARGAYPDCIAVLGPVEIEPAP